MRGLYIIHWAVAVETFSLRVYLLWSNVIVSPKFHNKMFLSFILDVKNEIIHVYLLIWSHFCLKVCSKDDTKSFGQIISILSDQYRSGASKKVEDEKLNQLLQENSWQTQKEFAEQLNITTNDFPSIAEAGKKVIESRTCSAQKTKNHGFILENRQLQNQIFTQKSIVAFDGMWKVYYILNC